LGGKNLGNLKIFDQLFAKKRSFLAKIQGFEAFLEAISVSCGFFKAKWPIFQNFLLKYPKNMKNLSHFRFLWIF
jgi:hypothetical protein